MKNESLKRSQSSQILLFIGLLISLTTATTTDGSQSSKILVRMLPNSNTSSVVPKILRLTQNGHEEVVHVAESLGEPLLTLKSDPVKVQSNFRTVDISVLNRQRDTENAKKVAIIQQDLQSRIKINEPETQTNEPVVTVTEPKRIDPEELIRQQARVKEDIESRVLLEDGFLGYRQDNERSEKFHYPVKRSDDDYYADEPEPPQLARTTPEPAKEEDSFFSIFESLFGSSDDDSQSKKKSKPEDDIMFKDPEDPSIKENIKTVGDILKPLKPVDEPESKTQNVFSGYQSDVPEYRIVNNYHAVHKQEFKPTEPKPNYYNFYRPTEKPFRPYRPHSTNGYEDYDLEEFLDKGETTTPRVKYVSPLLTSTSKREDPTTTSTTTTTTTTTTTSKATTKNNYENKLKFPSIQKKNDYINRNRYQEVKNEVTERRPEKVTERTTYQKPEVKTTTEIHHYSRPNYETKINEVKPQKIQESPNFYNLINLPVRYSTKDTAIPLISTSYANTKIQGMGAHKYEKGANGKYPNHKYDQASTSTTKRPNYWATKRTSTEKATTSFRPSPMIPSTTKHVSPGNTHRVDYNVIATGMGPEYGGYGSKTGVEVKTQAPVGQTSTTSFYKETTTRRNDELESAASQQTHKFRPNSEQENIKIKEIEKTPLQPVKDVYEEYEYESFPAHVQEVRPSTTNQNYPPQANFVNNEDHQQKNEVEQKLQYQINSYKTTSVTPLTESEKPSEVIEYEYYDYEDLSTVPTTTSTTTPKYKIKYPGLPKDKIKGSNSEKVAVVIPSKDHDFYESQSEMTKVPATVVSSTGTTATTHPVTTTMAAPKFTQTTTTTTKITEPEATTQFKKTTTEYYKPNKFYKEPAPVFEDVKEQEEYTTREVTTSTRKIVTEKPTTTEATVKPVIVTSAKDQESNVNIVLVPTKETVKNVEAEEKYSQPEPPPSGSVHKPHPGTAGSYQSGYDYTTEFTVGVVHGGNTGPQKHVNSPSIQGGHYVASSISTNPYGDDEPFRPIPKPPGMTSSFHLTHEEAHRQSQKNPTGFQNKRPLPTPPSLEETEPIHEPHEFIPSPQFHRPIEPKPSGELRPGADVDYDLEGIQTEPKPGQYVIFSKPQLNPEMNENQLKKKPEIKTPTNAVSNIPHYHQKIKPFGQDVQKHVTFKEGQNYQNSATFKPPASDKTEQNRPVYGGLPEVNDDQLPLQLVPPRGTQTEKPFEGNFVVPETEKQESTVTYPRPHWEKNGKPSFLMNNIANKNDLHGSRLPPLPPQMAPTLIPPSSIPPQRFRRPIPPHMPPMRKNFNEAGTNVKPKPNLPNILPQFRPNAKVGNGPYHRPPGYVNSNRRNGVNRYHDKEHGNFPYHIQYPDKEVVMHREHEMAPEIIPKFITNRGKPPSELWNSQGMQKRFGQGLMNIHSRSEDLNPDPSAPNQKILRRLQRTPVTTLQMLKQMPGVKTQKTQVTREDSIDPSAPLAPPIYKTFVDKPKNEENLYIVYPAKAPQKLHSDNTKIFIVSDTKSQKNHYNFTKPEDQHPLLNPNKRINPNDKPKNGFPYGFIKAEDRLKLVRKQQEENEEKNVRPTDTKAEQTSNQGHAILSAAKEKDEKIDMNLHMQSNNQWNEVKAPPNSLVSVQNPGEKFQGDHYRFSEQAGSRKQSEIQINPPSEYHTSIKDENDSAFTLGAVMHTMSEANRKGQVASVSLHNEEKEIYVPKLNVNERISNGKIVTVSMPLDVKEESSEESKSENYNFQPPFQASSSITSSESHPTNQGWSVVKNPDDTSEAEEGKETTETTTSPHFSFENFKPELIGGFKPIYELPEEPEESKTTEEKSTEEEPIGAL